MVAPSLPFWMTHTSRVMSPFPDQSMLRFDPLAADDARRVAGVTTATPRAAGAAATAELVDAQAMTVHDVPWGALAARALEPNVFLEPGFALPALHHFPPSQRPGFLLVWSTDEGRPVLIGLCALRPLRASFGPPVSGAWLHDHATTSIPLLDRDRAGEALDVMLDWFAHRSPGWVGLLLGGVSLDGPVMRLLSDRRCQCIEIERRERVVLRRPATPDGLPQHSIKGRRAKELRRQARRLGDLGLCSYSSAVTAEDVRAATERFLDLEARGWKGRRGTAMLKDSGLAAFTRAMTRRMARAGLCRVDTLEIDGAPAAMGVVLRSGDRGFFWKTTFDESLRRYSPGKLLAQWLAATQRADATLALTDSCAVPDHSMIGHVWSDRMMVADLLVAGPTVEARRLRRAGALIRLWRRGRAIVKRLFHLLRRDVRRA